VIRTPSSLVVLFLAAAPMATSAQTLGASSGLQIIQESGSVRQYSQVYVQQRGIGATNLDQLPKVAVDQTLAPAAIVMPLPVIQTPLPNDFRLSITNTDQVQDTVRQTRIQSTSVGFTSAPLPIQLR
jgi:hypothetical protein